MIPAIFYFMLSDSLELRTVVCAGSEIRAFLVHAESVPASGTEDFFFGNIVHSYRYSEDGAECDEVCADMTVADCAVVCAQLFITSYADLNAPYVAVKTL